MTRKAQTQLKQYIPVAILNMVWLTGPEYFSFLGDGSVLCSRQWPLEEPGGAPPAGGAGRAVRAGGPLQPVHTYTHGQPSLLYAVL